MKMHEAAVEVLRETDNQAVMFGDEQLLHLILERADPGCYHGAWEGSKRVLDALSRDPGILKPGKTMCGNRVVRVFRMPEE